jgi:hypothetical protein
MITQWHDVCLHMCTTSPTTATMTTPPLNTTTQHHHHSTPPPLNTTTTQHHHHSTPPPSGTAMASLTPNMSRGNNCLFYHWEAGWGTGSRGETPWAHKMSGFLSFSFEIINTIYTSIGLLSHPKWDTAACHVTATGSCSLSELATHATSQPPSLAPNMR